jgi:Amt family ammonium transporter
MITILSYELFRGSIGGKTMTIEFWYLIGAALVFFMQAGFAMVETGFTRAKNAGNIIMKNLMDFCIGTVVFMLLGFGLMMGRRCILWSCWYSES